MLLGYGRGCARGNTLVSAAKIPALFGCISLKLIYVNVCQKAGYKLACKGKRSLEDRVRCSGVC